MQQQGGLPFYLQSFKLHLVLEKGGVPQLVVGKDVGCHLLPPSYCPVKIAKQAFENINVPRKTTT